MSEVTFAKSFLATLDKRPIKLPADHVSDPRQYPNQSPYTLPKLSTPFPISTTTSSSPANHGSSTSSGPTLLTALIKPTRALPSVPASLSFPALDPSTTTIHDLKTLYAEKLGLPGDKVKILYSKKPVGELKTLEEVVGKEEKGKEVEFGVMLLGGVVPTKSVDEQSEATGEKTAEKSAADKMDIDPQGGGPESEKAQAEAQKSGENGEGQAAREMLRSDGFWEDLQGFLAQRLRDDKEGKRLVGVFREAWKSSS